MGSALARLQRSHPWRAWTHCGARRGTVLAAGIAYVGFFSLFPALALAFTALGLLVGGRPDLQLDLAETVNDTLGSVVIGTAPGEGVVPVDRLVTGDVLTVTGALGAAAMLFTGLGWVDAMRQGIRAMFDLPDEGNPLLRKLFDVLVLAVLGVGLLASAVIAVGVPTAGGAVLALAGVKGGAASVLLRVLVDGLVLALDVLLFVVFFRVLARVRRPVRELLGGAVLGALGLTALKLGAGLLLRLASSNRFLASASILIGLLVWFNLVGRLTLLAAAWTATAGTTAAAAGPDGPPGTDGTVGPVAGGEAGSPTGPEAAPPPARSGSAPLTPIARIDQPTANRVVLAAGVTLGVTAGAVVTGLIAWLRNLRSGPYGTGAGRPRRRG